MIAGKQDSDTEKIAQIKTVLRKLCPDIGFLGEVDASGQLILCGKDIATLRNDLDALKMLESILELNIMKTRAILSIKEKDEKTMMENDGRGEKLCAIA